VLRDDTVVLPLRWEATGAAGRLFPVLDADLVLTGDGGERSTLALTGAYRPPLGGVGAVLDRALLNRAAAATITRKRAGFHNCLSYAVELGMLEWGVHERERTTFPLSAMPYS